MATTQSKSRLVICCDGTACSEFDMGDNESSLTNVSRIARAIDKTDDTGDFRQVVLYLPGIGTNEGSEVDNAIKSATGKGLNRMILEAYTFLAHNWLRGEDEIILIGFSRGAFAMRCLADFIIRMGLLSKEDLHKLPQLFQAWKNERFEPEGQRVNIRVCALWDTVGTMGIPWITLRHSNPPPNWLSFVHSDLDSKIENAFQALSLHEHRYHFHPLVWRRTEENVNNLEQCWFSGYHGDVGGSDKQEAISHFALIWMVTRLKPFLSITEDRLWRRDQLVKVWRTPFHERIGIFDSLKMFYHLAGSKTRKPRCHFRNSRGLDHRKAPISDKLSCEQIHATARFLQQTPSRGKSPIKHFHHLEGFNPPAGSRGCEWLLRKDNRWNRRLAHRRNNTYSVQEQELCDGETSLLESWAQNQHRLLYDDVPGLSHAPGDNTMPKLGERQRDSMISEFRYWLRRNGSTVTGG